MSRDDRVQQRGVDAFIAGLPAGAVRTHMEGAGDALQASLIAAARAAHGSGGAVFHRVCSAGGGNPGIQFSSPHDALALAVHCAFLEES